MENKEYLQTLKKLRKHLRSEKGFGKKTCKEMDMDCPNCMGQTFIGFINWAIDNEEFFNND